MLNSEPYRPFFLLGTIISLFAAGLWIPQVFHLSSTYPVAQHSFSMISGFILCFIFGFLLTAIPRFTETEAATPSEIYLLIFFIITSQILTYFSMKFAYLLVIVAMLFLIVFLGKRFSKRAKPLPFSFIFIPLYIISTLLGLSLMLFDKTFLVGKKILYYGSTDYIILGVGSMLIPALLGIKPLPTDKNFKTQSSKTLIIWAILLVTANALFVLDYKSASFSIKLIVNLVFAIYYWHLTKIPKNLKWFKFNLWIGAWIFILSPLLNLIYPNYYTHMSHLNFIAGISLITFTIASHVILSHGKYLVEPEKRKIFFLFVFLIIFVAVSTRISAIFLMKTYLLHLGIAAIFWNFAILIWFSKIGKKCKL